MPRPHFEHSVIAPTLSERKISVGAYLTKGNDYKVTKHLGNPDTAAVCRVKIKKRKVEICQDEHV